MDEDLMGVIIGVLVFIFLMTVVCLTGVLTHESHLRELRYDKDQVIACLTRGNTPQVCRDMVYGRGN